MANNRLVLLLAVAFVATIGPILATIGSEKSSTDAKKYLGADDQVRLEKLGEKILPDEDIKDTLREFQNQDYEFYYNTNVRGVLAKVDGLSVKDCPNRIFTEEWQSFFSSSLKNRNLALNLYKFTTKPWITFCAEHVKDVFKSIMENARGGCDGLFTAYNVLQRFEVVSDEPLSENYSSLIKGQYEELHNECKKLKPYWDLRSVSCSQADSGEHLSGDDVIRAKKVGEKMMPTELIQVLFDSFEKQDFLFCGVIKVKDALWSLFKHPDFCMDRIRKIESSEFAGVENEILAKNLHNFNVRDLVPYCAENFENVIKHIITGSRYKDTCASLVVVNEYLEGLEYFTGESFSKKAPELVRSANKDLFERCSAWDSCMKRAPHVFSNQANTEEETASKIALGANTKQVSLTDTEQSEDIEKDSSANDEENKKTLNEKKLPLKKISDIMSSFKNDRFVFFGNLNVRDMFDLTILHQLTIESCENKIRTKIFNPFAWVQNSILANNLYTFTRRNLIPFCAKKFEDVIQSIVRYNFCSWLSKANDFSAELERLTGEFFVMKFASFIRKYYKNQYDQCSAEEKHSLGRARGLIEIQDAEEQAMQRRIRPVDDKSRR